MHVIIIVVGLLLLLFGGGCTFISLGYLLTESRNVAQDLKDGWWILVFLGLGPLALGAWMFRAGLRIDREKRNAGRTPPESRG